jgi:Do/DeqQ family serine protease
MIRAAGGHTPRARFKGARAVACALFVCLIAAAAAGQTPPAADPAAKAPPPSREALRQSFAPVVKRAAPAVVNIYTRRVVRTRDPSTLLFDDPFFRRFFGEEGPFAQLQPERQRIQNALGSGVIVDPAGLIVTNSHVVHGADEIRVVLNDRREFDAKVIETDDKTDLTILRVEGAAGRLPSIELADSDALEVGDLVLAIGNPFGIGQTVTSGIVSALARTTLGAADYSFFIQTDAAINPGNSGGALVDLAGRLVGINTVILSRSGGSHGIGFAIPSNMVRTVVAAVATGHKLVRPWLGASGQRVTAEIAETLGLAHPVGVLVDRVHPGGPADRAGVKSGDVITAVDGLEVGDPQGLRFRVATKPVGGSAALAVMRQGRQMTLRLPLAAPPEIPPRETTEIKGTGPLQGAVIANMSPALAVELSMDTSLGGVVVVEVKNNSRAQRLRLRPGDFVVEINDVLINDVAGLRRALSQAPPGWKITVRRGERVMTATFPG